MKRMVEKDFFQAMLSTNSETSITEQNNLEMLFTEYLAEQLSSGKSYLACSSLAYARIELMIKIESYEASSEKNNAPNLFRRKLMLLLESCISLMKHQLTYQVKVDNEKISVKSKETGSLKWTANTVDLVELIYGLHSTKCVNHGDISIGELAQVLGKAFNTEVRDVYKRYANIQRRKKNRAEFIDSIKSCFLNKMND